MRLNAAAKGLGQDGPTKGERVVPLSKGIGKRIIIFQSIKNSLPSSLVIVLSRISGSLCSLLFASFVASRRNAAPPTSRAAGPILERSDPQGDSPYALCSLSSAFAVASRPFGPILKLRPWRDGPQAI